MSWFDEGKVTLIKRVSADSDWRALGGRALLARVAPRDERSRRERERNEVHG